jgi:hypothetical protein
MSFLVEPTIKGLIAEAGPAQSMLSANLPVTLDGTGSVDANGEIISYEWTQTAGAPVILDDPNSATPSFMPAGELTTFAFELTVTNQSGLVDTDITGGSVYLTEANGTASGHNVLNKDRCELGLQGVWVNASGTKSCTFLHPVVEMTIVNVNEGTIFIDESQIPDGPRNTPQYRGNVSVILTHQVRTTYTVANTTSGIGHAELDGPWYSNIVGQVSEITSTSIGATVLTCQRRTMSLLGWGSFGNRALTECAARATFQFPAVLQGVEFELP